jgi:hypothetical protein
MTNSLHHHPSTGLSTPAARSVHIDSRRYPASQRNLVAASLLARPDKVPSTSLRPATWWRA